MKKWVKIVIGLMVAVAITSGAFLTDYLLSVKKYQSAVDSFTYVHTDASNIPDGSYIGECDVQFIYAKVCVTVKDHLITDIELLEYRHDRGAAAEGILKEITVQQKIDVDVVAGATNSSKVIKKAIGNALSGTPKK